jgi:hypothetical protein
MNMLKINDLGSRICIIGPSSTGKSTLAKALGAKLGAEVCYLDQMAHWPDTNWQRKPDKIFQEEHRQFLALHERWIIEGNYSFLMKERFAQATSIIWLDYYGIGNWWRYAKRSGRKEADRPGNLAGAATQWSWHHFHYMLFKAPQMRSLYRQLISQSGALVVTITSYEELKKYYQKWGLTLY